jgi:hypothetical protein
MSSTGSNRREELVSEIFEALESDRVSFEESPAAYELLQGALNARQLRLRLGQTLQEHKQNAVFRAQEKCIRHDV